MTMDGALVWLSKPLIRAVSVRELAEEPEEAGRPGPRMSRRDARRIFRNAWSRYAEAAGDLPHQPTLGSRLNVRLASLTLELVRAMEAHGLDRETAIRHMRSLAWVLYRRWATVPKAWGLLRGSTPLSKMEHMVRAFLRFPFSRPGYDWSVSNEEGVVRLDIVRCPVADFFLSEGAGDVCAATWCTLDYPLGEFWGGRYERDGTLASGDPACHMRWIPAADRTAADG